MTVPRWRTLSRAKETAQLLEVLAQSRGRPVPKLARWTLDAVEGDQPPYEIIKEIELGRSDVIDHAPIGQVEPTAAVESPDYDITDITDTFGL
jgi:hypothetical protein